MTTDPKGGQQGADSGQGGGPASGMAPPDVPGSWEELGEMLFEGSWDDNLQRHRLKKAFRGAARVGAGLFTTLTRVGGDHAAKEPHLIRNFRKYAHPASPVEQSLWNWLALAAHHGLPTRLLDWTFSPYVALHFATSDLGSFEADGEIWCVDFEETNRSLPESLRATLREEGSQVFTGDMLWRHAKSLPELDGLSDEPFVLFLEPPSLDHRIVNQAALFSLMSSSSSRLDDWLALRPPTFRRVLVPASLKWEVRDKLDQANVTERVLFPGLDGLSRWLTRYYTRREQAGMK
jgi:hypothetical protein